MNVLIIDDEKNIRATLRVCLEAAGHSVVEATNRATALSAALRRSFDLAFVDMKLAESSGLDLLPELLAGAPGIDVILITAHATVETAVEAIRRGAYDYLPKPFTPSQIRALADRVAGQRALRNEVDLLRSQLDNAAPEVTFDSESPAMRSLLAVADKAAQHDVAVLLVGENGTGKSVLARRIHQRSARAAQPFVLVSCPTLSEDLLTGTLFGHARGAFTTAVKDQPGRVEAAERGTLFLDEIGELPTALQAKLLRFLQDKSFERIGENETRQADVRIVAATNRNLAADVAAGRFREDLYYRLNTFELAVLPLRQRPEDIVPLARRFAAFFARSLRRKSFELTDEAERALAAWHWPGNLRELRNAVERAAILAPGNRLSLELFPERMSAAATAWLGGDFTFDEIEREHMARVLARHSKVEEAARVLGVDTSTLWRKRKRET